MSNDINNPYSERAEEFKEWAEKVLRLFADIRKLSEGLEEDYKTKGLITYPKITLVEKKEPDL